MTFNFGGHVLAMETTEGDKTPSKGRHKTFLDCLFRRDGLSVNERKELRRNRVRVWATNFASFYLFFIIPGFALLILMPEKWGVDPDQLDNVKDLLLAIMPIASSIVAYWFGSRGSGNSTS